MKNIDDSGELEAVPTSYVFSFLFYAFATVIASAASVFLIAGGIFASWRLYLSRTLKSINIDGLGYVWAVSVVYYGTGFFSAILHPDDTQSVAQVLTRLPFLFLAPLIQFFAQADPRRLLLWSAGGGMAGIGFLSLYWGFTHVYFDVRFEALSGNPNIFGYVCSVIFVMLCVGLAAVADLRVRIGFLVALPVCLAFVFASGSRAALIAVMTTISTMGALCLPWRRSWVRAAFVAAACVLVLLFTGVSNVGERSLEFSRKVLNSGFDISQFNSTRAAIWQCGWEIAWRAPVLGEGHGNAISEMGPCTEAKIGRPLSFTHFHNVFLDQFAKYGLSGLVSTALLLFMPILLLGRWLLRGIVAARTQFGLVLTGAILSFWLCHLISGMVNIGFGHDAVDGLFIYTNALLFGMAFADHGEKSRTAPTQELFGHAASKAIAVGADAKGENEARMKPELRPQMGQFGIGIVFGAALLGVIVLFLGYTTGLNRLTVSSGGYAVSVKDAKRARDVTLELRDFVDRLEVELLSPNSSIQLPDTVQFHSVAAIWKAEFDKLSVLARAAQAISVRKDGADYKILLSGPVCPIAVSTGLFSIDPRRPSQYATLCNYFADWGGKGASF